MFAIDGYKFEDNLKKYQRPDYDFDGETQLFFTSQYSDVSESDFNEVCTYLPRFKNITHINFSIFGSGCKAEWIERLLKGLEAYDKITSFTFNFGLKSLNNECFISIAKIINQNAANMANISIADQISIITPEVIPDFAEALKKCVNLTRFEFTINSASQMNTQTISQILQAFESISKLQFCELTLFNMGLSDEILPHLTQIVKNNKQIRRLGLQLDTNNLTDAGIAPLIEEIINSPEIKSLMFSVRFNKEINLNKLKSRLEGKQFSLYNTSFRLEDLVEKKEKKNKCTIF